MRSKVSQEVSTNQTPKSNSEAASQACVELKQKQNQERGELGNTCKGERSGA